MPETKLAPEQLADVFHQLEELLVENGGEETPEVLALLTQIQLGEKGMVDRYASFVRHLEAKAKGLTEQADRYAAPLTAKAASAKALAERLKARLLGYMQDTQQTELKGELFKARRQQSPEALQLTDAGKAHQWPAECYKPPVLDTAKVKDLAKQAAGSLFDGEVLLAKLGRSEHVRIY